MYMISSSKIQKPIKHMTTLRRYIGVLERVISCIEKEGGKNPLLEKGKGKKVGVIVITSDLGLCGGFNHNVIRLARTHLEENEGKTFDIFGIGKKAKGLLRGKQKNLSLGEVRYVEGVFRRYEDVKNFSSNFFSEIARKAFDGEYEELLIFHNQYKSMMIQEPQISRILPFQFYREPVNASASIEDGGENEQFLFEENLQNLMEGAVRSYIEACFYLILISSYAGENAARMISMDKAVTNADNLIADYTLKKNTYRQSKITTEVAEIAAGAAE